MKSVALALGAALTAGATMASAAVMESQFPPRTVRDLIEMCTPAKEDPMMTAAINYCHGFAQGAVIVEEAHETQPSARKLEVDRVLTGGRRSCHPIEPLAARRVADTQIVIVARRIGWRHGIGRSRRNRCRFELRDGKLSSSRRHAEKNVRIQQTEDRRELRFAGYLSLPARDCDRKLQLAVKLFIGPVEINLYILQDTELARADTGTCDIGALAPYCARAEAQLHIKYSLSIAASASPWRRGRYSRPACRGRLATPGNGRPTSVQSAARSKHARRAGRCENLPRPLAIPSNKGACRSSNTQDFDRHDRDRLIAEHSLVCLYLARDIGVLNHSRQP